MTRLSDFSLSLKTIVERATGKVYATGTPLRSIAYYLKELELGLSNTYQRSYDAWYISYAQGFHGEFGQAAPGLFPAPTKLNSAPAYDSLLSSSGYTTGGQRAIAYILEQLEIDGVDFLGGKKHTQTFIVPDPLAYVNLYGWINGFLGHNRFRVNVVQSTFTGFAIGADDAEVVKFVIRDAFYHGNSSTWVDGVQWAVYIDNSSGQYLDAVETNVSDASEIVGGPWWTTPMVRLPAYQI